MTPGAQIAMLAVLTTLARPGDVILSERITYPGIKALAAQLGLILHGVACDAEGLLPDSLDEACRRLRPRLLYCNPTIQNPTTVTISPRRRAELAADRPTAPSADPGGTMPTGCSRRTRCRRLRPSRRS